MRGPGKTPGSGTPQLKPAARREERAATATAGAQGRRLEGFETRWGRLDLLGERWALVGKHWQKDRPQRRDRGSPGQRLYLRSGGSPPLPPAQLPDPERLWRGCPLPVRGPQDGTTSGEQDGGGRESEGPLPARWFRPGPGPAILGNGCVARGERGFSASWPRSRCRRSLACAALRAPRRRPLVRPVPPRSLSSSVLDVRVRPPRPSPLPEAPGRSVGRGNALAPLRGQAARRTGDRPDLTVGGWSAGPGWEGPGRVSPGARPHGRAPGSDVSSPLRGSQLFWTGSPRLTRPGQSNLGRPGQGGESELTGPGGRPGQPTSLTPVPPTRAAMEKMSRVTTALGGSALTGRTMHCHLDAPANAISVCRDAAQVVVAGRSIFKIYAIEDEQFVEKLNLRVGRKPSLNLSCADVVWHQMDENLLATAATNGVVVTWNLGRPSRNKQDQLFTEHKRTVNKVCFHPTEAHVLLSGSQDGFMKCFDLRRKDSVSTFSGQSESVRDVQFSIRDYFTFASTFENGNVQLWDIRRPDRCERMFTAHNGPVFCCDWHPEDRGWLATGGRDKMVKVWDMSTHRAKEVHCVQTIASVARVKWRPECRHHLATCSMMVDHNIYVWDVRRPFVPAAMFEEHRDVTTGIAWRHPHDPSFLLSGSKDSTLCQHLFRDASQPVERANPEGLCYGLFGDLAFAAKESLVSTESGRKPYAGDRRHPIFFKRKLDPAEPFVGLASSALSVFEMEPGGGSMSWFVDTAERYALAGRPLAELCDHNAKVARELGRNQVAQTWTMLRIIYSSPGLASATSLNHSVGKGSSCGLPLMNSFNLKDMAPGLGSETRLDRSKGDTRSDTVLLDSSTTLITNEDNEETEGSDVPADYLLGDVEGEEDELYLLDPEHAHPEEPEYVLPQEAFPLRHEIVDTPPGPEHLQDKADSPHVSGSEADAASLAPVDSSFSLISVSHALYDTRLPPDFFSALVCDMLRFYAEQGDVQMAVSVLIVLGERVRKDIDEQTQEHWYASYIDLLQRFCLWNVSNQVVKLSTSRAISCLNQASTTLHVNCSHCKRPMSSRGWVCDRCHRCASMCAVCHHVVKGLFVWCQGCSHGGHLQHIMKWLQGSSHCPAGCGHLCEYS